MCVKFCKLVDALKLAGIKSTLEVIMNERERLHHTQTQALILYTFKCTKSLAFQRICSVHRTLTFASFKKEIEIAYLGRTTQATASIELTEYWERFFLPSFFFLLKQMLTYRKVVLQCSRKVSIICTIPKRISGCIATKTRMKKST